MVSVITVSAQRRENKGKGSSRSLRREGRVPAIVYGQGEESIKISLEHNEIKKYYNKSNFCSVLLDINLGDKSLRVIPKEVQFHPVTDIAEHIDFIHVSGDKQIKVVVHLHFINEDKCLGIKRGGALNIANRNIEVMCPINSIPKHIDVDVTDLNLGSSIQVSDLALPKGVSAVEDGSTTIATVVGRAKGEASEEGSEQ